MQVILGNYLTRCLFAGAGIKIAWGKCKTTKIIMQAHLPNPPNNHFITGKLFLIIYLLALVCLAIKEMLHH